MFDLAKKKGISHLEETHMEPDDETTFPLQPLVVFRFHVDLFRVSHWTWPGCRFAQGPRKNMKEHIPQRRIHPYRAYRPIGEYQKSPSQQNLDVMLSDSLDDMSFLLHEDSLSHIHTKQQLHLRNLSQKSNNIIILPYFSTTKFGWFMDTPYHPISFHTHSPWTITWIILSSSYLYTIYWGGKQQVTKLVSMLKQHHSA